MPDSKIEARVTALEQLVHVQQTVLEMFLAHYGETHGPGAAACDAANLLTVLQSAHAAIR